MLDGIYAAFSPGLPSEWASCKAELVVIEAVANSADSTLETEATIGGNIVVVSLEFEPIESHRDVEKGDRL